jgi:hypothetical protein
MIEVSKYKSPRLPPPIGDDERIRAAYRIETIITVSVAALLMLAAGLILWTAIW